MIRIKEIKQVSIDELKPHPKNMNKHPKDQIDRLSEIIRYQGFRNPVVVSTLSGFVVHGHGRIEAAKKLGMKMVPVSFQDFDDETQEYASLVSDNAISEWSDLDLAMINSDLPDLGPDFDVDLLGLKNFSIEFQDRFDEPDPKGEPKDKDTALTKCPNCGVLVETNG